ncbi:GspH/FimT family pseudopilin [Dyella sp. C9]|uniref:GspH/FimT family pseudopilin n=1 Tax=Dyella sp. C9 TaxID=2202154 RepID=UPI001E61F6A4|nr:GspH/FimT family pseudopilin [Dyella sp. C9]
MGKGFWVTDMADRTIRPRSLRTLGERGFTLIELVVALVVAAILIGFAIPAMHTYIQNNRVVAQANGLIADLQYARGEAVATHGYISVCPLASAGGNSCDTTDGSYAQGWMVFTTSGPGTNYNSTTGTVLRVQMAPTTTTVNANSNGILTYDSYGQLWASNQVSGTSFTVCAISSGTSGSSAIVGSMVNVSSSGRIVSMPPQTSYCSST